MARQYITKAQKRTHLEECLNRAANRRVPKLITIDVDYLTALWEKQRGRCCVTGLPLEITKGGYWNSNQNPFVASIDRIDNKLGYIEGNVRIISWFWNDLKSTGKDSSVGRGLADVFLALHSNGTLGKLYSI